MDKFSDNDIIKLEKFYDELKSELTVLCELHNANGFGLNGKSHYRWKINGIIDICCRLNINITVNEFIGVIKSFTITAKNGDVFETVYIDNFKDVMSVLTNNKTNDEETEMK